jgi:hypothetical protein
MGLRRAPNPAPNDNALSQPASTPPETDKYGGAYSWLKQKGYRVQLHTIAFRLALIGSVLTPPYGAARG